VRYLLLLYIDEAAPQEGALDKHVAAARDFIADGAYVTCNALTGSQSATTVRVVDGQLSLSDGPFAETKEVLGGYYLVDCPDLDAAIAAAAKLPAVEGGAVEIRPVFEIPGWDEAIGLK
jgi:hypothetical protein